jgi:DNA-directed RNA polymerase subunit RPC12/RpoP
LLYLYGARYYGQIEDSEFKEQIEDLSEVITNIMSVDPDNTQIKESLGHLERNYPRLYDLNSQLFNSILQFPVATSVSYPCPTCGDRVKARKFDYGRYGCPHCNSGIKYGSGGYSRISPAESFFDNCFIATAVYGSPIHPKVCLLRKVRNELLVRTSIGRAVVRLYYRISPSISRRLAPRNLLSAVVRRMLVDPICLIGSLCLNTLTVRNVRNQSTHRKIQSLKTDKELEEFRTW